MENGKSRKRAAAFAGGEVGDLLGGHLAGDLAGRRGAEVRRRRVRDHPFAGVGEGRGVGGVRVGEAGSAGVGGGCRGGVVAGRERSARRGAQGDGGRAHVAPGKATLGLFGPVPARVSAETKLELLGLIDRAVADGWAHTRACRVLDLADSRAHHWRARLRETGTLEDGDPGGGAVHGILAWEEQAILDLIETWGPVDRSHRKLAHRGSYTGTVFVSPSTVLRVALKNRVKLPGEPFRPRPGKPYFQRFPGKRTGSGFGTQPTSPAANGSRMRSSMSSPDTGSAICSPQSRRTRRCSCCSPARWRTRTSSMPMACHRRPRTASRSWSRGQTTAPR